jgi:hypothetical protein
MDCQSGYPLTRLLRVFLRSRPTFGMPCLGQCLHVGIDGMTHVTGILVCTKMP